ncbi:toxin-antitoxin system protein [Escherichia coli]|nr:toxin-antitoxin system protein [Escherichia coli]EFB4149429.1 toxin-antitoxin system protein [Escherichia coli O128]EHU5252165.1 toxin-antitoxin system protein [Salmonella enterica subsp. enterica serovar Havana]EKF4274469.1 toxin-antitoxin system protein [Escherichia coli O45]EKH5291072.1 toxin-antitoxin system protein [Escherichia coli O76]EKY6185650.1 toxin-antitoxin system protein [Escherichia coli O8]
MPITVKHRGVDIRDQVKAGRQQLKRGDVLPHDMVESSATAWRDEMSRKVAGK